MRRTVSASVNGSALAIYFRTKRIAAVTCARRTRTAAFRNIRHLMQKLVGKPFLAPQFKKQPA